MHDGGGPQDGRLQPLGVGEILDAAVRLYRRSARSLWRIVLIVIVPVAIIEQLAVAASLPSNAYVSGGSLYTPTGTVGGLGLVVELVLGLLAVLVLNGALAICLVDSYIGNPIDWRTSLQAALARLGPLVWLALLYGALVFIGFVLFVVPGIYLVTVWCVAIPAVMFEEVGAVGALGRSQRLTRGRWWPTFAALLATIVALVIVLFVVGLVFGGIESGLSVGSIGPWLVIGALGTIVTDLIVYPFIGAVVAVIYIDLRVRHEELDLGRLAGALGRPSPPGLPPSWEDVPQRPWDDPPAQ
ncbi:MAG: hypothetical protein ACRDL5_00575 [Solirubrobacteraceae bacterium]